MAISRQNLREHLISVLYIAGVRDDLSFAEVLKNYCEEHDPKLLRDQFFQSTAKNINEQQEKLDKIIKKYMQNWNFERNPLLDRCILRLGCYELLSSDTPPNVALAEAVRLANRFCADDSHSYINGILASINKKEQRFSDAPQCDE